MDKQRLENAFFIALLAIAVFLAWLILEPYVGVLIIAGTFAFIFRPLYKSFLGIFRYEALSAVSVIVVVILIIVIPLTFCGLRIVSETTSLYASLSQNGGFDFGAAITRLLRTNFTNLQIPDISLSFNDIARGGLAWLLSNLQSFFSNVANIFFATFLTLLGLFYFLKDGGKIKKWALTVAPLNQKYTEQIIHEAEEVAESVIEGTLVVAIIQGFVVGVGFLLFRIPDPVFWGTLTILASIVPIVGTWLVVVPGVAYLFLTGQIFLSVGLAIWSVLLVNLVYNLVTPQFVNRKSDIHPFVILLSILGGLSLFGPIGFLMGPLIVAFLFSLLNIYPRLITKKDS